MKASLGIVKLLGSANVSQTRVGFGCNISKTLLRCTIDKIVFFATWPLSVNRYSYPSVSRASLLATR